MLAFLQWFCLRHLRPERRLHRWLVRHNQRLRKLVFAMTLVVYPAFCVFSWARLAIRKLLFLKAGNCGCR